MNIRAGWAYSANAKECAEENEAAFNELLERIGGVRSLEIRRFNYTSISYCYEAVARNDEAAKLTAKEAALIVAGGHLPFGGNGYGKGGLYHGTIYID